MNQKTYLLRVFIKIDKIENLINEKVKLEIISE